MGRTIRILRKVVVACIGIPLLIIGIILIPIPGPGLLTTLLALFILSWEFDWATPHFKKAKNSFKKIIDKSVARYQEIENKKK